MTPDNLWSRYSAIWSQPADKRAAELSVCVAEHVTYRDPNEVVVGRDSLSEYMGGFQSMAPGCRFQIESVQTHHGRSLARWTLRSPGNDIVQEGSSFAEHRNGVFTEINGFFESAAAS